MTALQRAGVIGAVVLVLLSVTRLATGTTELTSAGTAGAALALAVPIGLAGLGGLWAERAGVVNIGLEGMMILGTWMGAFVGYQSGPWAGALAGTLAGAVGGLVHAVATVSFGVDHVISGVAINILGAGVARYLSATVYRSVEGAGPTQSPPVAPIGTTGLPVLSGAGGSPDLLGSLASRRWFLVSDVAGVLRGVTGDVSLFTLLAVVLVPVSFVLLWRTGPGLRLRSVGESPLAAASLGVGVFRTKYVAVVVSGAFAGLAGSFLVTVASSNYQEGQTGGRGFIALAAMIFGNWRPVGLAAAALLFGYADALQLRVGENGVHGLLLFTGLLLALVAVLAVRRGQVGRAVASGVAAGVLGLLWLVSDTVPSQLVQATPYVVTLLVLSLAAQRLRPPAADGIPYRRGQQS